MNRITLPKFNFKKNGSKGMYSFFRFLFLYCLLPTICFSLPSEISAQTKFIYFQNSTLKWEGLMQLAESQGKLVFLYVYEPNSAVCSEVEHRLFNHPKAIEYHNGYFVNYKLNGRDSSTKELINYFDIQKFPCFLYFNSQEKLLYKTYQSSPTAVYLESVYEIITDNLFIEIDSNPVPTKEVIPQPIYENESKILNESQPVAPNPPLQKVAPKEIKKQYTDTEFKELEEKYISRKISSDDLRAYLYALRERQQSYHTIVNQYLKMENTRLKNVENRQFLYDFLETIENNVIHHFLEDVQHFKIAQGSPKINDRIKYAIQNSIRIAIKERDEVIFERAMEVIQKANLPFEDGFEFEVKMMYYEGIDNWEKYGETAVEYVKKKNITNPQLLNELAYKVALHSHNTRHLEEALKWAKQIVDIEHEYPSHYTLTYVYYRLKNKKEALLFAEKTLEIAEFRKIDQKEIRDLIDDIRTRL